MTILTEETQHSSVKQKQGSTCLEDQLIKVKTGNYSHAKETNRNSERCQFYISIINWIKRTQDVTGWLLRGLLGELVLFMIL